MTEQVSGPQLTFALPQLPFPVQNTSHVPWPQLIVASLHEPALLQEMVQSLPEQLNVAPWQAPFPSQRTSQGHPGGQFRVCALQPPPPRHAISHRPPSQLVHSAGQAPSPPGLGMPSHQSPSPSPVVSPSPSPVVVSSPVLDFPSRPAELITPSETQSGCCSTLQPIAPRASKNPNQRTQAG